MHTFKSNIIKLTILMLFVLSTLSVVSAEDAVSADVQVDESYAYDCIDEFYESQDIQTTSYLENNDDIQIDEDQIICNQEIDIDTYHLNESVDVINDFECNNDDSYYEVDNATSELSLNHQLIRKEINHNNVDLENKDNFIVFTSFTHESYVQFFTFYHSFEVNNSSDSLDFNRNILRFTEIKDFLLSCDIWTYMSPNFSHYSLTESVILSNNKIFSNYIYSLDNSIFGINRLFNLNSIYFFKFFNHHPFYQYIFNPLDFYHLDVLQFKYGEVCL
ncbi:hypothetical protein [Methanobrevibacter sp.]|uniref:hypothetical protein n=1 Tax=Methanobrevibacter sp. TaxID=66852 RepID=UPI00388DDB76